MKIISVNKYLIQVAPIIPLPVSRTQVFSYWHSENISPGTLVSAPFYFRDIQGIVVGSSEKSSRRESLELKNIRSVIEEKFLNENQIKLARKIAEYYFAPLGSVLKLMVPKVVKQRVKKTGKIGLPAVLRVARRAGEEALKIINSKKNKFLLIGGGKKREKINADLIQECLKSGKQCLILAPEIFFSHNVYEKLNAEFSEEIALIHSRITKGQYYSWWEKIKTGKIRIIIASKQGIFLPFSDLGLIIIQDEQDISFKQWESMPRYSGVRGAEFLADIAGAKLVLESFAPSAETLYRAKNREIEIVETKIDKSDFPKFEIVSLEKEKKNPDFPISNMLYSRLAEIVNSKKQAVVFVNRRGFSTRTTCENCKKFLKCPKCDRALIYSEEQSQYRCLHCAYKMELFSACPSCGGFQFSHRGIGTQTVEKKIKRLFSSARVVRLDADAAKSLEKYRSILQDFSAGKIDILVGTQSAIKGIYSDGVELAASISGRDFTDGIEFNSRALALSRLFYMANLLNKNGILTIQSFFGGNPLFDYLEKNELKKYFVRELAMRKKLSYPPFRKFVKLGFRDKSERKAVNETKKTFDLLRATSNNEIEIIGPYAALSLQKRGLYQRNILLKFDPEKNIGDLPVRSAIGALRKGWSVDVDPVSIF
ncbi:MAG: primosomal protein N' [Candidatus Moraniibacteriota bacterium]